MVDASKYTIHYVFGYTLYLFLTSIVKALVIAAFLRRTIQPVLHRLGCNIQKVEPGSYHAEVMAGQPTPPDVPPPEIRA